MTLIWLHRPYLQNSFIRISFIRMLAISCYKNRTNTSEVVARQFSHSSFPNFNTKKQRKFQRLDLVVTTKDTSRLMGELTVPYLNPKAAPQNVLGLGLVRWLHAQRSKFFTSSPVHQLTLASLTRTSLCAKQKSCTLSIICGSIPKKHKNLFLCVFF